MVHVLGRSRVRLAWQTHYVGDVRGVNNELLDSYQLKSLDGVIEGPLSDVIIEKHDDSRFSVKQKNSSSAENFALRQPYDVIIRCLGWKFDKTLFNRWEQAKSYMCTTCYATQYLSMIYVTSLMQNTIRTKVFF